MASSTRSALSWNSLPGTSCIAIAAVRALDPFDADALQRLDLPAQADRTPGQHREIAVAAFLVACEVRSFSGQSGQVSALFSRSGGWGMISSWVTEAAPWRFEVPMQSEPVSPPPMTRRACPSR